MKIGILDKLIVLMAVGACVVSFAWFWQGRGDGVAQYVEVRSPGEVRRYSLLQDRHIHVETRHGSSEIVIEDGRTRFLRSSCNKQVCVLAGWLERAGQMAVCIPNGISLRLVGNQQYDAINF
ncbi:MAG: NusG domain II-containing protein [Gammaproteobacteria bacterium]|nr:NusG domain II-containing protein [Gammaproteobacteria bacterium]